MKAAPFETGRIGFKKFLPEWLFSPVPRRTRTLPIERRTLPLGKRVLVVDDDAVVRMVTSRVLQSKGYEVATAADCSAAIAAIGQARPDVALLDLDFPPDIASGGGVSWNGLRLMSWLIGLQNAQGTRFIIITNSGDEGCRQRALAAGAVGFFQKPINYPRLLRVIAGELQADSGEVITPPQVRLKI